MLEVGDVVTPTDIPRYRSRVGEHCIVELAEGNEANVNWLQYLAIRSRKPIAPEILAICGVKPTTEEKPSQTTTAAKAPAVKAAPATATSNGTKKVAPKATK